MIDLKVLEKFGTTNERLRQICESKTPPSSPDGENPEVSAQWKRDNEAMTRLKDRISSRLDAGVQQSLASYQLHAAVDLAWDAVPLNKETVPLQLFAQGKLTLKTCSDQLKQLGLDNHYVQRSDTGSVVGINVPKFLDVNINLVRSVITRRTAAQAIKYTSQYPHYSYTTRSNSTVGRLFGDIVSEIIESQVDAWGHRHSDVQVYRAMLLHAQCIEFVRSAWESEKQVRFVPDDNSEPTSTSPTETVTIREGVNFVRPHPTRVFKDPAFSWSSLNSDNGISWCGYWDVVPWKSIKNSTEFFNRSDISFSTGFVGLFETYSAYWSQYYTTIRVPSIEAANAVSYVTSNDAKNQVGYYSTQEDDAGTLIAVYFEKVVPADIGCGSYPYPVWMRIVTAGMDGTPVYCEWLPSRPGAAAEYNFDDGRVKNLSLAMELMGLQDQLTNLFTQLLAEVKCSQLKVIPINTDLIRDEATLKQIEATLRGNEWYNRPFSFKYSAEKLSALGLTATPAISIIAMPFNPQTIQIIFQAIREVIEMAERLAAMSPNESGQPMSRSNGGISATEAQQIESTTSTIYSFVSQSIDAFREAKKRIIFESWAAFGSNEWQVSVMNRYPRTLIENNGFEVVDEEMLPQIIGDVPTAQIPLRWTVRGTKRRLFVYDYIFSSRDGASRPINSQSANTLVQLLPILQQPQVLERVGADKFFEIVNAIFRLAGAGVDLRIEPGNGPEALAPAPQAPPQGLDPGTQQIIDQIIKSLGDQSAQLQQIQAMIGQGAQPSTGRPPQQF